MLLQDKRILVTGASTGIGRAIAVGCAREGAHVALNHLGDKDNVDAAVAEISAMGRKAIAIEGDVADPTSAQNFVDGAVAALGRVDVFVSNAGICPFHAFLDMPLETFERTMRVNLHGAYYMVQAAANRMVEQGDGGAIIAMSSISALVGGELQTHYTPTKAGVLSLMQSCAIALGKHRIRCNALMPGAILTNINREYLEDDERRAYFNGRIPLGRIGDPEDLVGPAVFFASDLAKYVTGAALLVDGGMFVNLQ